MKYQVKDPEHYPIEIRYFLIYTYIKISEPYLITNPFSSYITSITFREIINFLKLEKGFRMQKYIPNVQNSINLNESSVNNSINLSINKNSEKKSKRRKSISKTKKRKKKNKKKSVKKEENKEEKINYNIDTNILESYLKVDNSQNSQSKPSKSKKSLFIDDRLDQPQKLISKTLFNYLCFIYSMQNNFKSFSEYFDDLYAFIDEYIKENINDISLDEDWTWLVIYSIKFIKKFNLQQTYEKFEINISSGIASINNLKSPSFFTLNPSLIISLNLQSVS